jgi:hypothetical protein
VLLVIVVSLTLAFFFVTNWAQFIQIRMCIIAMVTINVVNFSDAKCHAATPVTCWALEFKVPILVCAFSSFIGRNTVTMLYFTIACLLTMSTMDTPPF